MKKKLLMTFLTLLFAVSLSTQGANAANLLQNGSFESPQTSSILGSITSLPNWTVNSGNIDILNNSYWQAQDGTQSIDLTGSAPGTISQSFATTPSQMYELSFYLSGNPDNGTPLQKSLDVVIDGVNQGTFTYDRTVENNTYSNMKWRKELLTFYATGSTTTLSFATQNINNSGPALDNVNVSPVPEPSSLLLGIITLAGGVLSRRRKK